MTMPGSGHISNGWNTRKFDVVFVLPHMGRGGAQRVVSLVANAWAREGREVCVLTWLEGHKDEHALEPQIGRLTLHDFREDRRSRLERAWDATRDRLRRFERWMRPRWPWRARRLASFGNQRNARRSNSMSFSLNRASLRVRRRLAKALISLDARFGAGPESFARLATWYRKGLQWILPRLVFDERVEVLREALVGLAAPVVVSLLTRTNVYVLEAARGLACRVIVSERNDLELQDIDPALDVLRSGSYERADVVTANTKDTLARMAEFVSGERLRLLPNPIVLNVPVRGAVRGKRFVAMARLVPQKGIDVLLRAFARIADDLPDWSLEIVGDGPLRAELEALAVALGVADRVTFHGYLKQPFGVLQSSRVFVLPSRFEGMPNSLLEAMACGLAPIVTDASAGPLDCVTDDKTGLVVATENIAELADAMRQLASDDRLMERLARGAMNFVREHDWSVVEAQWIEVLGLERSTRPMPDAVRLDKAS